MGLVADLRATHLERAAFLSSRASPVPERPAQCWGEPVDRVRRGKHICPLFLSGSLSVTEPRSFFFFFFPSGPFLFELLQTFLS